VLGIGFTIISSFWFGVSTVTLRRGVIGGSAAQGVLLTVLGGVPLFLVAATLTGQIFHASELRPFAYLALACAGVIHFLYGRYCMYQAYGLIGANRSAPISQATTVLAVLIAVGFLNEQVTLTMGLGITFVIIGSAITAGDWSGSSTNGNAGISRSQLFSGYAWAALGTLGFGTSPVLIRFALEDSGLGIFGGFVSYAAAGLVLSPLLAKPGVFGALQALEGTTHKWFLAGTITIFLGHMFRFLALTYTPVSIAIPLLRSQTLVAIVFGYLVSREHESFDRKVLVGIAIALVGSVVLVL
jgi:drug/metabolite transporter (DMT)-like permease